MLMSDNEHFIDFNEGDVQAIAQQFTVVILNEHDLTAKILKIQDLQELEKHLDLEQLKSEVLGWADPIGQIARWLADQLRAWASWIVDSITTWFKSVNLYDTIFTVSYTHLTLPTN